jgi:hypothetical protein
MLSNSDFFMGLPMSKKKGTLRLPVSKEQKMEGEMKRMQHQEKELRLQMQHLLAQIFERQDIEEHKGEMTPKKLPPRHKQQR